MRTVYVIGVPAAGKSTALARACELLGWRPIVQMSEPVPHVVYSEADVVQIGRERALMGGTDALSMSIGPKAIDFVLTRPAELLIGEGDRLAYDGFLDACQSVGHLELVLLDLPLTVARERAIARTPKVQNATWVRGRVTKLDNLVARRAHRRIDASRPPEQVAADLASLLAATRAAPGPFGAPVTPS